MLIETLRVIIYILLAILLIISIILGIKLILVINSTQKVIDDVQKKVSAFDSVFDAIETTSNRITGIYSKVMDGVIGLTNKIFTKKQERDEEDE